jgi:hypothetical protein
LAQALFNQSQIFFTTIWPKGEPLPKEISKKIFFKQVMIIYAPIDYPCQNDKKNVVFKMFALVSGPKQLKIR